MNEQHIIPSGKRVRTGQACTVYQRSPQIFRHITSRNDQDQLEEDLNSPQEWETKWLLRFHLQKYKIMTPRSRKKIPPDRQYYLDTQGEERNRIILQRVSQGKTIYWRKDHTQEKVKKTNQPMELIRSFSYLDIKRFRWLFMGMVCQHLEYAQSVCFLFREKDIITIENVQRRATQMSPGIQELGYSGILNEFDIPKLVPRRIRWDMIEVYKILNGRYAQYKRIPEYIIEGTK